MEASRLALSSATPTWHITRRLSATILSSRRLYFPVPQRNCATWQPPVEICCNGQDASISETQLCLVIRDRRGPGFALFWASNRAPRAPAPRRLFSRPHTHTPKRRFRLL